MESYSDDPSEMKNIPTGMETDPEADEQVIDQTEPNYSGKPEEVNPSGLEKPTAEEGTTPVDDIANALAYAIDGSGTGIDSAPPAAPAAGSPQKLTSEGVTGAGPDDESGKAA